ncbi:MAG TPA: nuclear transport factor 2 family protein [Thermoleophilaceae bacterium]|nr:nuclear transport factor 2 family protein [Thermoleophilaceae bacterium]
MRPALLALGVALALGGCSLGDGDDGSDRPGADSSPRAKERQGGGGTRQSEPDEAAAIRAWSGALNDGDFDRAAAYFAPNAIVEQTQEIRLADRRAAIAFNRSLPCKADVTDVEDEGETVLAAFRLRDGTGGPCDGSARVRFTFRDGKFSEWRQLAEPPEPQGPVAMLSH